MAETNDWEHYFLLILDHAYHIYFAWTRRVCSEKEGVQHFDIEFSESAINKNPYHQWTLPREKHDAIKWTKYL